MDFGEIYHFLFETYAGMGCLMGACFIIALVASIFLERGTKRKMAERRANRQDAWSIFGSDDDDQDKENS